MKALIIGSGRVGSALANRLVGAGWEVVLVERSEEALGRLGDDWRHPIVLGHGMDVEVLERAGIAEADMVVAATDGDNTNLVIAQVAKQRYAVGNVAARIQDPARAEAYAGRGIEIVSPTKRAIDDLTRWALGTTGGG